MFPFEAVDRREVLYSARRAEIDKNPIIHPTDKTVLAVTEIYHKPELIVVNDTFKNDLQYLLQYGYNSEYKYEFSVLILRVQVCQAHGSDTSTWLVEYPNELLLYQSRTKKAEFLFNAYPELKHYNLSRQVGFDFKARDGLILQAYLSLPPEAALRSAQDVPASDRNYANLGLLPVDPQKLIVLVHGGPE
ncbi:hypothetical protein COOONC_02572 [Cooperia oncophora]